jgi:hypothetical protein
MRWSRGSRRGANAPVSWYPSQKSLFDYEVFDYEAFDYEAFDYEAFDYEML